MDRVYLEDRFDLQRQLLLDDKIHLKEFIERSSLVRNGDAPLTRERQSGGGQFVAQASLIDAFQQSRAEMFVYLDRATDNATREGAAG
jgi:hypothetical protein